MNQDDVKEILLQIADTELEFSVIFTGKKSNKVNGLYKPDSHEILLHNKNFSTDNELIYTAIHEYTHHKQCEQEGGLYSTRVHTAKFWAQFHALLEQAEAKGFYRITLQESPELIALTDEIKQVIMVEDGKLIKELGKLLSKARKLCKDAGVRYEDYIDRILCLPRVSAAAIEKINAYDINPELGYEAMKTVANIGNAEKRKKAEELFLAKNSYASVHSKIAAAKQEATPKECLEKEKKRLEKTILNLKARLEVVEEKLLKLTVVCLIFFNCFYLALQAQNDKSKIDTAIFPSVPAIPQIPDINLNITDIQRGVNAVPVIPQFFKTDKGETSRLKQIPNQYAEYFKMLNSSQQNMLIYNLINSQAVGGDADGSDILRQLTGLLEYSRSDKFKLHNLKKNVTLKQFVVNSKRGKHKKYDLFNCKFEISELTSSGNFFLIVETLENLGHTDYCTKLYCFLQKLENNEYTLYFESSSPGDSTDFSALAQYSPLTAKYEAGILTARLTNADFECEIRFEITAMR